METAKKYLPIATFILVFLIFFKSCGTSSKVSKLEKQNEKLIKVEITESSASQLRNTAGPYKGGSESNLLDLARARMMETKKLIEGKFPNIKVTLGDVKISGAPDCFGTGTKLKKGTALSSDIAEKCGSSINQGNNRKLVSDYYDQWQYVKLKAYFAKEISSKVKKEVAYYTGLRFLFKMKSEHVKKASQNTLYRQHGGKYSNKKGGNSKTKPFLKKGEHIIPICPK